MAPWDPPPRRHERELVGSGAAALPASVRIGGLDRAAILAQLRGLGVQLNRAGERLFADARFRTLPREQAVAIQAITPADLGFPEGATYGAICRRAVEVGLVEAPLELAPHLRLQHLDQAEGAAGRPATRHRAPPGSITVASAPLEDDEDTPRGFYLRRIEGELWLRGYVSGPDHIWSPEDVLVFARTCPLA